MDRGHRTAHDAMYRFERALEAGHRHLVAFVKAREDGHDFEFRPRLLEGRATVVDVDAKDASDTLGEVLQLTSRTEESLWRPCRIRDLAIDASC